MDWKVFGGLVFFVFDFVVEKKLWFVRKVSKEYFVSYSVMGKVLKNYLLFNRFFFIEEGDV